MIGKLLSLFKESQQSFAGQEPGEEVILIIRRHYFTVLLPLSVLTLFALLPPIISAYFGAKLEALALLPLAAFLACLYYLVLWLLAFHILAFYALNTVVITSRRLIENEQHRFFDRKVSELQIYRVQDVSVHVAGLIETLFSYGEIAVQTAGSEREFTFSKIAHPERVKDAIMQAVSLHRSSMRLD